MIEPLSYFEQLSPEERAAAMRTRAIFWRCYASISIAFIGICIWLGAR
jgi:hypothetical protein